MNDQDYEEEEELVDRNGEECPLSVEELVDSLGIPFFLEHDDPLIQQAGQQVHHRGRVERNLSPHPAEEAETCVIDQREGVDHIDAAHEGTSTVDYDSSATRATAPPYIAFEGVSSTVASQATASNEGWLLEGLLASVPVAPSGQLESENIIGPFQDDTGFATGLTFAGYTGQGDLTLASFGGGGGGGASRNNHVPEETQHLEVEGDLSSSYEDSKPASRPTQAHPQKSPSQDCRKMTTEEADGSEADSHKDPDQDSKLPYQDARNDASGESINRNDSLPLPDPPNVPAVASLPMDVQDPPNVPAFASLPIDDDRAESYGEPVNPKSRRTVAAPEETSRRIFEIWLDRYRELVDYKSQHGHCRVPQRSKRNPELLNPELASWVRRQRRDREKLSRRQVDLLNELGFDWRLNQPWVDSFFEFADTGHIDYHTKRGRLGRWVVSNRSKYKKWRKGLMPAKQRKWWEPKFQMLDSIGFCWEKQGRDRDSGDDDDDEGTGDGDTNNNEIEESQEGSDETQEPEDGDEESSDFSSEH